MRPFNYISLGVDVDDLVAAVGHNRNFIDGIRLFHNADNFCRRCDIVVMKDGRADYLRQSSELNLSSFRGRTQKETEYSDRNKISYSIHFYSSTLLLSRRTGPQSERNPPLLGIVFI